MQDLLAAVDAADAAMAIACRAAGYRDRFEACRAATHGATWPPRLTAADQARADAVRAYKAALLTEATT